MTMEFGKNIKNRLILKVSEFYDEIYLPYINEVIIQNSSGRTFFFPPISDGVNILGEKIRYFQNQQNATNSKNVS